MHLLYSKHKLLQLLNINFLGCFHFCNNLQCVFFLKRATLGLFSKAFRNQFQIYAQKGGDSYQVNMKKDTNSNYLVLLSKYVISQWVHAAGNLTEGWLVSFLSSHLSLCVCIPSSVWFMKQCSLPMCVSTGSGSLVRRCAPEELCLVSGQHQSAAAPGPLLFFSLSLSLSVRIQTCTSIHQHAFFPLS